MTAHRCTTCDYFALRPRPECKEQGHDVREVKTKQRGFKCKQCKQHTTVLMKRLPDACTKCGSNSSWAEAGIRAERSAPLPSEEFMPRGEEHGRFRNSAPERTAERPAMASVSSAARAAPANPNIWQATLPVDDTH